MEVLSGKFKPAFTVAIILMILGISIVIDNPNNGNLIPVIAAIALGWGSILVRTSSPIIAIPVLGFIGFIIALTILILVQKTKWFEKPIAFSLAILISLNTFGYILWAIGHVEGYR